MASDLRLRCENTSKVYKAFKGCFHPVLFMLGPGRGEKAQGSPWVQGRVLEARLQLPSARCHPTTASVRGCTADGVGKGSGPLKKIRLRLKSFLKCK